MCQNTRRTIHRTVLACCLNAYLLQMPVWASEPVHEVVLIGGPKSHGPGEHDFANGIQVLERLINSSSVANELKVLSFPTGWPSDETSLDRAATLVFYFDGAQTGEDEHPLANGAHRAEFERLMKRGVGLITFHQASTVGSHDTVINLPQWLGGARYGTFDRTVETVLFEPAAHLVTRGVGAFELTDEFYPTIRFDDRLKVIPLLVARLHPQFREGKPLVIDKAEIRTVGWAVERPDQGRAFSFTGLHFLTSLDNPAVRTLVLNAVAWTAHIEVPANGVHSTAPGDLASSIVNEELRVAALPKRSITEAVVSPAKHSQVLPQPWGRLTWYVSRELKNSDTMTVGQAVINPGQENPRHYHPNCDEVLHVVQGHILHTMGDKTIEMFEGDTVSIPAGIHHNAKNLGAEPAVLAISFSSADRIAVGE